MTVYLSGKLKIIYNYISILVINSILMQQQYNDYDYMPAGPWSI